MAGLEAILQRLEGSLGTLHGEPTPIDGGITNHIYRARFGDHDCVIRLPGKDTALLGISREAERAATEAAAALGIAPDIIAAFDDCLVTRFIECRQLSSAELTLAVGEIAAALRAFHSCGLALPVRFHVPALLEDYARIVGDRGGVLPPEYAEARTVAGRIASAVGPVDLVPCHDDLLGANLIRAHDDGRVLLVDWEYAGMGDRFFDLGNLSVNNGFDTRGDELLLEAYFGEPPSDLRRAALALQRIASDVREAVWGVVQGCLSDLDFDFAAYAQRHFERLLTAAADPCFEDWLSATAAGAPA